MMDSLGSKILPGNSHNQPLTNGGSLGDAASCFYVQKAWHSLYTKNIFTSCPKEEGCCQAKFSTLGCPSCFFLKAMKISVQRFIVTFDSLLVNLFYFRQIWLEVDLEEPDIIKTMVHIKLTATI
jgi:hypothetical protein